MYADKLDVATAVKKARKLRKQISIISEFPLLLLKLENALEDENLVKEVREKADVKKDLKKIHSTE